MRHVTYCAVRLGDNLAHAHFLRKLAFANPGDRFVHYLHGRYAAEILNVVADVSNVEIRVLAGRLADWWNEKPEEPGIDAWKNSGGFWERDPLKLEYGSFSLAWFDHLAGKMGVRSPLERISDLLFDYPRLCYKRGIGDRQECALVVNSQPMSGQAPEYLIDEMDELIFALAGKFNRVYITEPRRCLFGTASIRATTEHSFTVTDIGLLSQACQVVILVSTGPSWTSFNIWNERNPPRFIGLINGQETVNLSMHTRHAHSVAGMTELLREAEIL
jgi:hypothetical protein